jgi:surfeit locus 1 family protein
LVAPTLAAAVALAILIGLGTWQWNRKAWKDDLIATIAARSAARPLDSAGWRALDCRRADAVGLAASCDWRVVRLSGTFEHDRERHIFISVPRQPNGIGGPGYWVMTPFRIDGEAGSIYVNRGFVPEASKAPTSRRAGLIADRVDLTGYIRTAEARLRFSAENSRERNVYFVRDPVELGMPGPSTGRTLPSDPQSFYIDQIGPPPPGGLPLPIAGKLELPNRHLEYALTWWGLALALGGVWAVFVRGLLYARP